MAFDYRQELYRYKRYYQRIEPIIKKPETAAITMLILSFFTLSFFGFFAIRPTLTTIVSLNREIEDSKFLDQQLDQKISALISAQESYQRIQPDIPLIYKTIPKGTAFPELLQQIESLAQEYNAEFATIQFQALPLSITPKEATKTASLVQRHDAETFFFTISLEADYARIVQFLERLIRVSRLIIIDQLR